MPFGQPSRLEAMVATNAGMRDLIQSQIRQVDGCLHSLVLDRDGVRALPKGEKEVFDVITTMIHMVGISGHSILKLTEKIDMSVRDAFPLARSIIEGVVNICFIMAEGVDAAQKASRHAEVRAFRDLKRTWEIAGMSLSVSHSGQLSPTEVTRLEAMLPEFTTKRGGERDWTDKTLKQRLETIALRFSSSTMTILNASAFNIYRHASEIVHGSYFSACFFWGLTLPGRPKPTSRDDLMLTLADHQFSVLMSTAFAYAGLLECFADYVDNPNLAAEAKSQLERIREFPAIAQAMSE